MSHINQDNPKSNNACGVNSRYKFTKGIDHGNRPYRSSYNNFQYYTTKYNFHPRWSSRKKRPYQKQHRQHQQQNRSPSPFSGTEEYTMKKIQEASDMIKKRLLMPETDDLINLTETPIINNTEQQIMELNSSKNDCEKNSAKATKKAMMYDVEEIQHKILTHITKLSHGRKVNLICSNPSGYDVAIEQIHKQKRLELSKALRDMCSSQGIENSEVINSIIPDIGIKIEDLPLEVIQELSSTLDWHFDDASYSQNKEIVNVKNEIFENDVIPSEDQLMEDVQNNTVDLEIRNEVPCIPQIKQEIIEIDPEIQSEANDVLMEHSNSMIDEAQNENQFFSNTGNTLCSQNVATNTDIGYEKFLIPKETVSVTVSLQTDFSALSSNTVSIQTVDAFGNSQFNVNTDNIETLDEAIQSMLAIDREVMRLTHMRQNIFTKLQKLKPKETTKNTETVTSKKTPKKQEKKRAPPKRTKEVTKKTKSKTPQEQNIIPDLVVSFDEAQEAVDTTVSNSFDVLVKEENAEYVTPLNFEPIYEKILVIKVIRDTVLAASDQGKIFYINTLDGSRFYTLQATNAPIISLCHWSGKQKRLHLIVGSSDTKMQEFDYETKKLVRLTQLKDRVQCMEIAWDYIFIGSTKGHLLRYSLKLCKIEFKENIAMDSVMVLKATQEGARRVLLVGMRNAPVTIRDAMSGLHLRTMNDLVTPTVYSLVLEKSMVYCGTTFHDILVYSFHDGTLLHKHRSTNSRGVSCMKVLDDLLFASCYNGNIYVYSIKTNKHVGLIEGPGGVILSMEVVKNIVIVGTMSLKFCSILIPNHILEHNTITII